MKLGELELTILKCLKTSGEVAPGQLYKIVKEEKDIAYTSLTTTIYRLVEKELVSVRVIGPKKSLYSLNEQGQVYQNIMRGMVEKIVGTFGSAAVTHILLENEEKYIEELENLRKVVKNMKDRESDS